MHADGLPTTNSEIAALIPHKGTMCLLDSVLEATAEYIVCTTRSHARADNPLKRNHRLSALALCEYGAQAVAMHGGLAARAAGLPPHAGLLVALREVQFEAQDIEPTGTLEVRAQCMQTTTTAWQYQFAVKREGQLLVSGRVTIVQRRFAV